MKRTLKILTLVTGIFVGTGSITIAHATEDAGIVAIEDAAASPLVVLDASVDAGGGALEVIPEVAITVPTTPAEVAGIMNTIAEMLGRTEWLPAFAMSLVIVIYALRLFVFGRVDWLQTPMGGKVLAFGTAFVLTAVTLYLGDVAINFGLVTTAAATAWAAAGQYKHAKDIKES